MKFTRMLSALFIAASLVLSMHSAASADHLQDIKARGTLRVAIPQDYPPFGFMGPDKQLKGYDIEMAGIVAKALGVKCELVPVTGANRIPFLLSNRADIVISTLDSAPGLERSPGEGNGNPLWYSCPENPMDRGA